MNILVVGGDQDALADVCDALKEDGHCAEIADTLAEVFKRVDLSAFSLVLLDRSLSNDAQHLHLLRAKAPDAAVIIITGYADLGDTIGALRLGAVDYLVKPRQPEWLKLRLRRIVEARAAGERSQQTGRLAAIGQMMSVLSHESRNDLQCAKACLEILALELDGRPQALDLVRRIEHAHDHLILLYEDLRGYAAPIAIHRNVHSVSDIVLDAWNSLLPLRKDRLVRLNGSNDTDAVYCAVDRPRLEQVFRNILENALAACPDPVEIRWGVSAAEAEGEQVVQIVLEDNGPGLSDEQQQRLFDAFYTTKSNGTGLGMTICKQIVEAHGGKIDVNSRPGWGAEFIVTLPAGELPRQADGQRENAATGGLDDVGNCCGVGR